MSDETSSTMSREEVPQDHSCIMHVRARRMRVVGSALPGWPSPIPYRVRARRMSVAQHFYVLFFMECFGEVYSDP